MNVVELNPTVSDALRRTLAQLPEFDPPASRWLDVIAAHRAQVPALAERRQRLAQGGPRDPQAPAQLALGGQSRPGREQPELDGRAQAVDRLLERGLRDDGCEDRVGGGDRVRHRRARS